MSRTAKAVARALQSIRRYEQSSIPPDDDESQLTPENRYVSWLSGGIFRPIGPSIDTVPAGVYSVKIDNVSWYLEPTFFSSDELLKLPGLPIDFITGQIDTFWTRQKTFASCGLLHKRGILLYGAAGCGKTSIIKLLANKLIEDNGIVLLLDDPILAGTALQGIRQIEPDRPILTVIEDIDAFMTDEHERRLLLAFLDGETQVNHVVHLATTNHPDLLDETIVKRPGRFDVVIELKQPVKEAREAYLRTLIGKQVSEEELMHLVEATAGLGLAHLRELVSATHCLGLNTEETLKRLKGNITLKLKSPKVGSEEGLGFSVGFGR